MGHRNLLATSFGDNWLNDNKLRAKNESRGGNTVLINNCLSNNHENAHLRWMENQLWIVILAFVIYTTSERRPARPTEELLL